MFCESPAQGTCRAPRVITGGAQTIRGDTRCGGASFPSFCNWNGRLFEGPYALAFRWTPPATRSYLISVTPRTGTWGAGLAIFERSNCPVPFEPDSGFVICRNSGGRSGVTLSPRLEANVTYIIVAGSLSVNEADGGEFDLDIQ